MIRLRIIQLYKEYEIGDIVEVTPNVAHGLIDSGVAIISKEMTRQDYKKDKPLRKK